VQADFYVVLSVLYVRLVCPSPDPVHHLRVAFSRGKIQQFATRLTAADSLYRIKSTLKPCVWLVRKLDLHVKRNNSSADFFVSLLNIIEPAVNALYAANCMGHFTTKDQNAQEALKFVLLEKENGLL